LRKSSNILSSVACNSTIAPNKTKTKAKILSHDVERKTQGSPRALQKPPVCKHLQSQMQTLTRMDIIVIGQYYYDMTTLDEIWNG
jgi:hypothetical protein